MRKNRFIWLAVDSNGDEKLTSNPEGFQRFSPAAYHDEYGDYDKCRKERNKVISYDDTQMEYDHWVEYHDPNSIGKTGELPIWNYLPKGTIKRILGYELTWEDEPVKIENYD